MKAFFRCAPAIAAFFITISANAAVQAEPKHVQQQIEQLVAEYREHHGIVGLGVAVMRNGELVASTAAGERKYRSGVPVTNHDKWHIGSISKSFTATVIARLVERDQLNWDTTIGEVLGDSMNISASWAAITLEQLLTHTSGASASLRPPLSFLFRRYAEGEAQTAARTNLVARFMEKEPQELPGSTFIYSNGGYLIAGLMAEKITGLTWEGLVRKEVFNPLGIQSGGFGHPHKEAGDLQQPHGHKSFLGFIKSTGSDPVSVLGPAGSIHIGLQDLLIYGNDHLTGERGEGKLLNAETYQKLHTRVLDKYGFGWVINPDEEWANGRVIWHNGSNGHWDALLVLIPETNTVIAIAANDGRFTSKGDITWALMEKVAGLFE